MGYCKCGGVGGDSGPYERGGTNSGRTISSSTLISCLILGNYTLSRLNFLTHIMGSILRPFHIFNSSIKKTFINPQLCARQIMKITKGAYVKVFCIFFYLSYTFNRLCFNLEFNGPSANGPRKFKRY